MKNNSFLNMAFHCYLLYFTGIGVKGNSVSYESVFSLIWQLWFLGIIALISREHNSGVKQYGGYSSFKLGALSNQ